MAFTDRGSFGTGGTSTGTGSTLPLTTTTIAVNKGDFAVVIIGADNTHTTDGDLSEISSVTDSGSNTWTKRKEMTNGNGAAGSGCTVSVWTSKITTALPIGSTVTVNFASTITARCFITRAFSCTGGVGVDNSTSSATDATSTLGSLSLSALTNREHLYIRGIAIEGSINSITNTTNYTDMGKGIGNSGGAALTQMNACGEFRILTGTGDTSAPTDPGFNTNNANAYIAFYEHPFVTADQQTYTVTTVAAGLRYGRYVSAAKQTYTLTAVAASTLYGRAVTAAKQTYTETTITTGLIVGHYLGATQQTYTVSPQSANTLYSRYLSAAQQTYTVTGINAPLRKGGTLNASPASFLATPNTATLSTSSTAIPGVGRSRAATMEYFRNLHEETQQDLLGQLAINDELTVIGDAPKKKKAKKSKVSQEELQHLDEDIADLDNELSDLAQLGDLPPLPTDRLDNISFPQQLSYTDSDGDPDADDEEVIAHLLHHLM